MLLSERELGDRKVGERKVGDWLSIFCENGKKKETSWDKVEKTQGERWEMKKKGRGMSPTLNVYTTE